MSSPSEIFSLSQKDVFPQKDIPTQKDVLSLRKMYPWRSTISDNSKFLILNWIKFLWRSTISDNSKFLIQNS